MLFNLWHGHGLPLTFTTDSVEGKRGGRLIEFVNSVIPCVTKGSAKLPSETVKNDIQRYVSFIKNPKGRRSKFLEFYYPDFSPEYLSDESLLLKEVIKDLLFNNGKSGN